MTIVIDRRVVTLTPEQEVEYRELVEKAVRQFVADHRPMLERLQDA